MASSPSRQVAFRFGTSLYSSGDRKAEGVARSPVDPWKTSSTVHGRSGIKDS